MSEIVYSKDGADKQFLSQPVNEDLTSGWWFSSKLTDIHFSERPTDKIVLLTGDNAWENNTMQEPSVWYYNAKWHMIYSGGPFGTQRLGYASANSPQGPWTKHPTPVIGGGTTHAGGAQHEYVYREGSTLYCYFKDDTDVTKLKLATANINTPTVWTLNAKQWDRPAGSTQWGNVCIFKDSDGTLYLFGEYMVSSNWKTSKFTFNGNSPTADLTIVQTDIPTLQPPGGSLGGPDVHKEFGEYVMFYHRATTGVLPTLGYRATSTDLTNWYNVEPLITRTHPYEVEQVADLAAAYSDVDGWWMFWTAMDNVSQDAYIMGAPMIPTMMRHTAGGAYRLGAI